jgi:hypothetical protein
MLPKWALLLGPRTGRQAVLLSRRSVLSERTLLRKRGEGHCREVTTTAVGGEPLGFPPIVRHDLGTVPNDTTRPKLTDRQCAVLKFIQSEIAKKAIPPSSGDVQRRLGRNSIVSAHRAVWELEHKGYIATTFGVPRSIRLFDAPCKSVRLAELLRSRPPCQFPQHVPAPFAEIARLTRETELHAVRRGCRFEVVELPRTIDDGAGDARKSPCRAKAAEFDPPPVHVEPYGAAGFRIPDFAVRRSAPHKEYEGRFLWIGVHDDRPVDAVALRRPEAVELDPIRREFTVAVDGPFEDRNGGINLRRRTDSELFSPLRPDRQSL